MIKFGTGGWRAKIGEGFTKANIVLLAQAIADYINAQADKEKALALSYDMRFLSKSAAKWVAEVLAANGLKVYLLDKPAPTPLTMYTVKDLGLEYGIAITASHNPYNWNGLKFFAEQGKDAEEYVTNELEERCAKLKAEDVKSKDFKKALAAEEIIIIDPLNDYIDHIMSILDTEAIKQRSLDVLIDPMHGAATEALEALLFNLRIRVDSIHTDRDAYFGGKNPKPSKENLQELKVLVEANDYDLGIATDEDGDRLAIISADAEFLDANEILSLLYYYYLEYKGIKTPIVRNLATTHTLDRIAKTYGQDVIETKVGFKYISEAMEESGALLGGESSGGLATSLHIQGKDGIYAAALICEMLSVSKMSIKELLKEVETKFGKLYTVKRNYPVSADDKERLHKQLFVDKDLPKYPFEVEKVSTLDGLKVYFKDKGWVLIRLSGTEPLLRIYAEMDKEETAVEVCAYTAKYLDLDIS